MTQIKAPRVTALDRINQLIDWYEQFKPDAGKSIPVDLGPKSLAKALARKWQPTETREFQYRGRTLIAIGNDPEPR